jgi:6-pyruvoyltetrahydropterin/6-carboxytetrahydropterin synthase
MPVRLRRVVGFRAEHQYWRAAWSAEQNRATFGRLTEAHAHDYTCEVTVGGAMDAATGMVIDLGLLDRLLADIVVAPLAGRNLNRDIPAFGPEGVQPTCEALAHWIFQRLAPALPGTVRLEGVRVAEDATLSAECTGLG